MGKTSSKSKKSSTVLFIIGGILLLEIAAWFSTATLDYTLGSTLSFHTSFFFFLAQPLILLVGLLYALVFFALSLLTSRRIAWIVMLAVSFVLIGLAFNSARLSKRLDWAIGTEASKIATPEKFYYRVHRLHVVGVIQGSDNLIDVIGQYRPLTKEMSSKSFQTRFDGILLPENHNVYSDGHMTFRVFPGGKRVYFEFPNDATD